MIAVDTNILVYAYLPHSAFHDRAHALVRDLAEGKAAWAIPWPCVHEFYSVVTNPRLYSPSSPSKQAIDQIEAWLESPSLVLLTESAEHWSTLKDLLTRARVQGPVVHDARVAALCLQHGVKALWSADRDFARFAPLKVINPLVA